VYVLAVGPARLWRG